jgi:hypothetical protein
MLATTVTVEIYSYPGDVGMMLVQCSWCGKDMGEKAGEAGTISHSICSQCLKIQLEEVLRGKGKSRS